MMRNLAHHSPLTIGALVLGISFSPTATAADKVTYDDDVLPIFESSCLNCHNADKKKGDLDLSNFSGVMAGGAGGAVASSPFARRQAFHDLVSTW